MKRINRKALFVISFPLVFFLVIHLSFNYLPYKEYLLYPLGGLLGALVVLWWQGAKHFLFATDIKIVPEKNKED
jgi:hypothetical protein